MSNNENNAKRATIAEICKRDRIFEIPPYQRLYEWESVQIEELLNDIQKACDESKDYFIGNITTSQKGDKYVLIDGQQRLTTLWFVGFYLASKGCESWQKFIMQGENLRIAMPIRDSEESALIELANNINGKKNMSGKENLAQFLQDKEGVYQNIIDAFKCIDSWFASGNGKGIDLADFAKYIYEKVCFVFVTLAEKTDLNRFFVRMNNRGVQLENHEILKAQILDVIQASGGKWQDYAKIWDLCSDMDKYIFQSASDRSILDSSDESGERWNIDKIIDKYDNTNTKAKNTNDDLPSKVESIIDFPTFLLHCYKLWVTQNNKDNEFPKEATITKDKLLDIFDIDDEAKWGINDEAKSKSCKWFIIDMLYYRVLFDYFVIKNSDDGFAIMRFYKDKGSYQPEAESFKELAMIQNYLRVARQGEKQNYHHWLTPFLKKLKKSLGTKYNGLVKYCVEQGLITIKDKKIKDKNWKKEVKNTQEWNPYAICEDFTKQDESKQNELVSFLENLDTKLAIAQLNKTSENALLDTTNEILQDLDKVNKSHNLDLADWDFLNNGTGTPHYWFYRLEYYLWKNGIENDENLQIGGKNFSDIRENFYFRYLNSVEHIQPQSKAEENDWQIHDKGTQNQKRDIDCFGNLALLSVGFNSALKNQNNADKRLELQKKINKDGVESLKLWLTFASYPNDNDWTFANATAHQNQMIKILQDSLSF
ncbi:DUF262 domain-containing protein [Helicobacter sp. T3_23-1056]